MAQHWQELLPIDRYVVATNGLIHEYDRKVLTYLYQPLIGPVCLSLYFTLWAEMDENRLWGESNSHHGLMTIMGMNLKDIYEARLKLEGIGLIKTFVQKEDHRSFIYELQPPLSPEQFFLDGMLNIYLYRKVGKNQFTRLKRFFSDKLASSQQNYQEVTRAFQDVFESATPGSFSFDSEMMADLVPAEGQAFVGRTLQTGIQVEESDFDFDLLLAGLTESLVPKKSLNNKVRDAIKNLSFLYGIDAIQMKNIVLSAVNADNEISMEELRKAARDWYQLSHQDQLPLLVDKIQPSIHQTQREAPTSKEEQYLHYLETTSPRQLLADISGGSEPSKADLQIIEDVMFSQKLLPGVVNVLIEYVLLKTDMKLTKGYIDKIAGHWARKKITTVKEAMDLAKKEHRQYIEWAEGKKKGNTTNKKKPVRTEMLPDWFDGDSEKPSAASKDATDMEAKKRALEERLKKYRK